MLHSAVLQSCSACHFFSKLHLCDKQPPTLNTVLFLIFCNSKTLKAVSFVVGTMIGCIVYELSCIKNCSVSILTVIPKWEIVLFSSQVHFLFLLNCDSSDFFLHRGFWAKQHFAWSDCCWNCWLCYVIVFIFEYQEHSIFIRFWLEVYIFAYFCYHFMCIHTCWHCLFGANKIWSRFWCFGLIPKWFL